jgi:hypothetical protein
MKARGSIAILKNILSVPNFSLAYNRVHAYKVHAHEVHVRDMHAHEVHACKMHVYEVHTHEMHACEDTPMRYTPMRYTPMKYMPLRCTPLRCCVTVQGVQLAGPLDLASVTAFKSGGCLYASHPQLIFIVPPGFR